MGKIRDWQTLIETLLQWEQWPKHDKLKVKHVKAAQKKHLQIMHLIERVGKRAEGMGLKIVKFHSIVHTADDILNFGVPVEVDTGSNESAHKCGKAAAKLTQKNKEEFDRQTNQRSMEKHSLDLAIEELSGNRLWNHWKSKPDLVQLVHKQPQQGPSGDKIRVEMCDETNELVAIMDVREDKAKTLRIEKDMAKFIHELSEKVRAHCPNLTVRSTHKRQDITFRATSDFEQQCVA